MHAPGGETTALQQFLFWFQSASAASGDGALPLVVDELLLGLVELAIRFPAMS